MAGMALLSRSWTLTAVSAMLKVGLDFARLDQRMLYVWDPVMLSLNIKSLYYSCVWSTIVPGRRGMSSSVWFSISFCWDVPSKTQLQILVHVPFLAVQCSQIHCIQSKTFSKELSPAMGAGGAIVLHNGMPSLHSNTMTLLMVTDVDVKKLVQILSSHVHFKCYLDIHCF